MGRCLPLARNGLFMMKGSNFTCVCVCVLTIGGGRFLQNLPSLRRSIGQCPLQTGMLAVNELNGIPKATECSLWASVGSINRHGLKNIQSYKWQRENKCDHPQSVVCRLFVVLSMLSLYLYGLRL